MTIQAGRQFGLSTLLWCSLVWELASPLPQKIVLWPGDFTCTVKSETAVPLIVHNNEIRTWETATLWKFRRVFMVQTLAFNYDNFLPCLHHIISTIATLGPNWTKPASAGQLGATMWHYNHFPSVQTPMRNLVYMIRVRIKPLSENKRWWSIWVHPKTAFKPYPNPKKAH